MTKLKSYQLVLISAVLLSISRLPYKMGFLVFLAWVPLLWFFERGPYKIKDILKSSALFSGIFVAVVLSWIASVTPGGLIGIWIVYIFLYGLAFYAIQRIWHYLPRLKYAGFAAVMISVEYLQQFGETRFPWLHVSYSLSEYLVLLQSLDLVGTTGLSLVIFIIGILLYRASKGKLRSLVAIALILIVWVSYGLWRISSLDLDEHEAGIWVSQPSIPQDIKWDADAYAGILARYDSLFAVAKADSAKLLILPEASFPVSILRESGQFWPIRHLLNRYQIDFVAGFPDYLPAPPEHYYEAYHYNAAALFTQEQPVPKPYYKNILVPVGERMLWLDIFPFLWSLEFGQANWEFGTELIWYKSGDFEFSPSICYEIAFPELYHRSAIPKDGEGYRKTDYLVNITNDAWFGTSYGPWLHGALTKYRAIENRIQIYRSAQTGISMIVDPVGRTIAKTQLFEITNITAPLYRTGSIPLIRRIYRYPVLITVFALFTFIFACFKPGKAERKK